jgi:hypothetical protein
MRKEAKTGIFITLVILAFIANADDIFNAITGFLLSGLIPGTQIAIPSLVVFTVTVLAISLMIVMAVRKRLPQKYTIKSVRGRFLQIEV